MPKKSKQPWVPQVGDIVKVPRIRKTITMLVRTGPITWIAEEGGFCKVRLRYGVLVDREAGFRLADVKLVGRKV
jgi:hypothetical protein